VGINSRCYGHVFLTSQLRVIAHRPAGFQPALFLCASGQDYPPSERTFSPNAGMISLGGHMHDSFLKKTIVALIWMPFSSFLCYKGGLWLLLPIIAVASSAWAILLRHLQEGSPPRRTPRLCRWGADFVVTQLPPASARGMLLAVIIFPVGFTLTGGNCQSPRPVSSH